MIVKIKIRNLVKLRFIKRKYQKKIPPILQHGNILMVHHDVIIHQYRRQQIWMNREFRWRKRNQLQVQ